MLLAKLNGHRDSIACLAANKADPNSIITGSDDKTARIWDLRTNCTVRCIAGCFESGIDSIGFGSNENVLYLLSGRHAYSFDLRSEALIIKAPISRMAFGNKESDECNALTVHPKGEFISVADEEGNITIAPVTKGGLFLPHSSRSRHRQLARVHSNFVNCITFRKSHSAEVLTGGFDCIGCLWDFDRGRPKASLTFSHLPDAQLQSIHNRGNATDYVSGHEYATEGQSVAAGNQMFNPPFVMGMGYICQDQGVVAALGDGTLRVHRARDLSFVRAIAAHSGMVTALYTSSAYTVTGGIDKVVHLFDNNAAASHEEEPRPSSPSVSTTPATAAAKTGSKKKKPKQKRKNASGVMIGRSAEDDALHSSGGASAGLLGSATSEFNMKRILTISHGSKINAVFAHIEHTATMASVSNPHEESDSAVNATDLTTAATSVEEESPKARAAAVDVAADTPDEGSEAQCEPLASMSPARTAGIVYEESFLSNRIFVADVGSALSIYSIDPFHYIR